MKKILIPTDFSELGDYAYDLASKIAENIKCELIALYVMPGPAGALFSHKGELMTDEGDDYSEWLKRFEAKKKQMKEWIDDKSLITDYICTIGQVDETILQLSEEHDIDLVVMGTEGLFNKSVWTKGSHTEYITQHAKVPVLSLKCDRSDLDLSKIVFVSDFLENKALNLEVVKTIQKIFNSTICLLKIKKEKSKRSDEQVHEDMEKFASINNIENYTLNIFEDNSVEAGIGKFCAEKDIDMIILGTHQSSGFSRLFRQSVANDVVNHLFHPILTFPIN